MRTIAIRLAALVISIAAALVLAETALRAVPALISEAALTRFPAPLRIAVARRLDLPTGEDAVVIASAARTDGGPPIRHTAPNRTFHLRVDRPDLDAGAIATVRMDGKGFCNPPAKADRTSVDVVVVGDSFTFCSTVHPEQAATARLEEASALSTYNLGINSIGPHEYVEILRRYGLQLKPRFVVLNVYQGNDLRDTLVYREFKRGGRSPAPGISRWARLLSHSYALSFLYSGVRLANDSAGQNTDIDSRYSVMAGGVRVPLNVVNGDLDEAHIAMRWRRHEVDMQGFEEPLHALADLAKEHHFTPLVTYIPSAHSAYADSVVFRDSEVGRAVQELSTTQRRWLAETAGRLGLPFLDVTPAFQDAARSGPLTHFPANLHLTPRGHVVVANAIAGKMKEMESGPRR